jgi:hypothetical protein
VTTRDDYTTEEWQAILTAPYLAAMLIIVSDMNLGFLSEIGSLTQAIQASIGGSKSELVRALAADAITKEQQQKIQDRMASFKGEQDQAALQGGMMQAIVEAAGVVSAKSPDEGQVYRAWLIYLAGQTAEGSKEGGFLGFGAVRVSDKEKSAMDDLAEALGVAHSEDQG